MSTIEKMSIQGIRSFGTEDKDKQVITFFLPLTLILGPNGTGKTTIIECLKYITTGSLPPGGKGGAFIHDPKVAHERQVKGQVRLQFKDVSGQMCTVQRSMEATQKVKKIETRTLEGVITRRNRAGEKQSVSSKCADLDREMITSLGVARPVLEYVIFCHQEDANWPLSEGKTLKEKFDAIFASTRYVKALETIRKTKQDQDATLKLYRQDIIYLKQHKEKAQQYEGDLAELEAKLAASKESVDKVNREMKPTEEKLEQIRLRSAEIFETQRNIDKLGSEMKQVEKHCEELKNKIENEFQGSDLELKRMLKDFEEKAEDRQLCLQEREEKLKEVSSKTERLGKEKSTILVEVGRLEQEAERQNQHIRERDKYIREYAQKYGFEGFAHIDITDERYKDFLRNLQRKLEEMATEAQTIKKEYGENEQEIQKNIDELKENKTKFEQQERLKRDIMNENDSKIRQINKKLSEVEASAGRLDQLKRELKRAELELQTQESEMDSNKLKQEISDLTKEKSSLETRISELSAQMNVLTLQASVQAQLDVLKKDKSAKEENIRRLKAKREDTVKYLLGHVPARNLRDDLDDYISKQTDEVRKSNSSVTKNKISMSRIETEKSMIGSELKKKEDELKSLEEKVHSVCGSQNFDEGFKTVQEDLTKAQDTHGAVLGAQHVFRMYAGKLEEEDPCCPLCNRDFETQQEVREILVDLRNKLRQVPQKLENAKRDQEEIQDKYDALMQLKPLRGNMDNLSARDIPQLKQKLKHNGDELEKIKNQISDITEDLQLKENDETLAKQIQPDIVMMDRYHGEIMELDKKIAAQAAKLSGGDSGVTLQQVIDEKDDLQMKVESLGRQIDHKRKKQTDHSDNVQHLRGQINSLREEKLMIENDLQQRIKLEEDKVSLQTENKSLADEISEAVSRLQPLQSKIDKATAEKRTVIDEKEERVETAKDEIEVIRSHGTKVKNINQEIKKYNQSGRANMLTDKQTRKNQIERKVEEFETEQKHVADEINKLREDLASQLVRKLDLENNLTLRKKDHEVDNMREELDKLKEKLGNLDVSKLDLEKRQLQRRLEGFDKERHMAEGRQRGFEDQIRTVKRELHSDLYKDAGPKYRDKMIELRTTELANGDLQKYYKAMDRAIMSYHSLKMNEINKIIRELWRNTYRGHDIETIEIRSDDDEGSGMKTRKTYNYGVVMLKGDTALDMRGRCSAGQKVLASLIIRLALAETFCLNCGILALDEPTTNLDRENIESLASALVDIIKSRAHQRNFQLVVITHDEDFVELLGRSEYVEEFFKVKKDQYGCSRVVQAKVQELHSR